MVELTVNLYELAEVILNSNFSYIIEKDYVSIMEHDYEEYCEKIEDYIAPLTEEGYIIREEALADLEEELAVIIKKKLYLRLRNQYNKFDTEDIEIEESEFRYYEANKDGD